MKLYYYTQDNGDGSASVGWCTEKNYPDLLVAFDEDESLYGNEGHASHIFLSDSFDLTTLGLSEWVFYSKEPHE